MNAINTESHYNEIRKLLIENIPQEYKGYVFTTDPCGSFQFIKESDDKLIEIYATPNWTEFGQLQIEIYSNYDIVKTKNIPFDTLTINNYLNYVLK